MKNYKGKNAIWLILIFVIYNLLPILFHIGTPFTFTPFLIVTFIIYYACNIIWIPILFRNHIELYSDHFIFYYGFQKETIKLQDIIKIEKSRNAIASSANSLDRIHIITKQKDFYVSLKDNDDFIQEIDVRLRGQ